MPQQDKLERRNYRKVYQRLWKNPDFRALTDDVKVMTLYLLTGPQSNRVGLFTVSFGQAADDLSTTVAKAKARLVTVCRTFVWHFDLRALVLWIPSWWSFNPVSENPKNIQGYLTDLNDVPRTALILRFCANLDHIPAVHHGLFAKWREALSPTDHRSVSDTITDTITDRSTSTETCTETETETETETGTETVAPLQMRAAPAQPVRPAFEHYQHRFINRYRGKPEFAGAKDGARMAKLLKAHGLDEVRARLDAFFDSSDPWVQKSGHTLDVFFSAGTQTKLVAQMSGPSGVSDRTRQNLANRDEALRLIEGGSLGSRR